jgi:hypothetical protein
MARKLTDIEVEEISLVDAAANRKKFSIIKREKSMDELIKILKALGITLTAEEVEKAKGLPEDATKAIKEAVGLLGKYKDEMPEDVLSAVQTLTRYASETPAAFPGGAAPFKAKTEKADDEVSLEKIGARLSKATKAELAKLKTMIGEGFTKAQDILDAMLGSGEPDPDLAKYAGKRDELVTVLKAGEAAIEAEAEAISKAAKAKDDAAEARIKKLEDEIAGLRKTRGISKGIKGQDDEPKLDKDGKPIEKHEGTLWPSLAGPGDDDE